MALTLRVDDFGGVTCIPSPPRNCAFAALFVMRQEISDRLISIVNVSSEEILRLCRLRISSTKIFQFAGGKEGVSFRSRFVGRSNLRIIVNY